MKSLYFWINFCAVIVPFAFSFHPKLKFNTHFKAFFIANFITASGFILWDIFFTKWGVWGFNPDYISGISLFTLPIEEVLFFVCIPFCCIYSYHCFNIFFNITWKPKTEQIVVLFFAIASLLVGISNFEKAYTATTFLSLSATLLFLKYVAKSTWLAKAFFSYGIMLLPFLIVNGILTGSGLPAPVVWYNDAENVSIRILTIPVEDAFYGFLLILINLYFYELFKKQFTPKASTHEAH